MEPGFGEGGELDFLQALLKRGFVSIPRMLFDYMADLALDYDTIGKLFSVMAFVGEGGEPALGPYVISRQRHAGDFELIERLLEDLEEKDVAKLERQGDQILCTFIPLLSRLRGTFGDYQRQLGQEVAAAGFLPEGVRTVEQELGMPLKQADVQMVHEWMLDLGFSVDMVRAIVREGKRVKKPYMSYLNQIAIWWSEKGIHTPEEAETLVQRDKRFYARHKSVLQFLGLKRQVTAAEQTLLDRWTDEWGFSNDVIIRACAETAGTQNPLQYANAILERWHEMNVRTVADAEQALQERKRSGGAAGAAGRADRTRRPQTPPSSNVILRQEKKEDHNYEHIYRRFDK